MSTRCRIAKLNNDGTVKSIYCHFDGYPSYVGDTLLRCYNTEDKIQKLIDLGDISSLGERLSPNENENHSFDNPIEGITVAYHRDRGENLNFRVDKSLEEFETEDFGSWEEFVYIFKNNKWYYWDVWGNKNHTYEELTQMIIDKD